MSTNNSNLLDPVVEDENCDDDCVILDFDPTAKETAIDTCKTDEVLVVGQKGEIACRDFPHPRHACAKYSFESTPHQNYCEMCHCYVCDTRAPCPYWFADFLNIYHHCHANDKEQIWKMQRELRRSVKMVHRLVSEPSLTIAQSQQVSQPSLQRVYQPSLQRVYNGKPSPQARSSNPYTRGVSRHRNRVQRPPYASPAVSQGNPQRLLTGYISTVPESHNKLYAGRDMYSANVQRIAVPSQTLNVPVNHHQQPQQIQQSGRSNDKVMSEFEEWLLDDSALTSLVSILPGQEDATGFSSDFERFLND